MTLFLGLQFSFAQNGNVNAGVQNLFGAGEIGGFNIAAGAVQIQLSEENVEKANELINSESRLTNPS